MRVIKLALAAAAMLFVVGCGGSGSDDGTPNPFAGAYRSDFSRGISANSSLLVIVGTNGGTTIVVSDTNGISFSGTGNTSHGGTVHGTANGPGGLVSLVGNFHSENNTLSASMSGAVSDTVTCSKVANALISPVAGSYVASYTGTESGTATVTISPSGAVTGTVNSPSAGTLTVNGAIDLSGTISFSGKGTVNGSENTITWSGEFFLAPGVLGAKGKGTWQSSSGASGTWQATVD